MRYLVLGRRDLKKLQKYVTLIREGGRKTLRLYKVLLRRIDVADKVRKIVDKSRIPYILYRRPRHWVERSSARKTDVDVLRPCPFTDPDQVWEKEGPNRRFTSSRSSSRKKRNMAPPNWKRHTIRNPENRGIEFWAPGPYKVWWEKAKIDAFHRIIDTAAYDLRVAASLSSMHQSRLLVWMKAGPLLKWATQLGRDPRKPGDPVRALQPDEVWWRILRHKRNC